MTEQKQPSHHKEDSISLREKLKQKARQIKAKIRNIFVPNHSHSSQSEVQQASVNLEQTGLRQTDRESDPGPETIIARTHNWQELYSALDAIGYLNHPDREEKMYAGDLKRIISWAYDRSDPVAAASYVTRTAGLRKKYLEFIKRTYQEREVHDTSSDFIEYGSPNFKLLDPERYFSNSVEEALYHTKQILNLPNWQQHTMAKRRKQIYAACVAVNMLMPYDPNPYDKSAYIPADSEIRITEILRNIGNGVCRHQAPFLTAVLKKLGYDAWQVWHDWQDPASQEITSSHTLVYINDPGFKLLLNPGEADEPHTVIPFSKYTQNYRHKAVNWRYRTSSNTWQETDWEKYL